MLTRMWRSVPGRGGSSKLAPVPELDVAADDDALAKAKPPRTDDSKWIRKGYIVTAIALLVLFPLSVILTRFGRASLTAAPTDVLHFLRTLNAADLSYDDHLTELAEFTEFTDTNHLSHHSNSTSTREGCDENSASLKVFMYDLPPEFHFAMIADFGREDDETWPKNVTAIPRYPGGLYQQHSPEYWLVSDLLTSDMPDRRSPCTAFRVRRWQDADVMLVPFFASLSYNKYSRQGSLTDRNRELQASLVSFLGKQPAWRARRQDHVVVVHHPNSMVAVRGAFRSGVFVVADFGRYGAEVANVRKDVVAPYKHVIARFDDDVESAASFDLRPTLLFFQGAIVRKEGGVIRQQLYNLLRLEPDVVFATGATTSAGIRSATSGMRGSKFCLHLAGDTPSSNRLFDAVASHCVPLIISDEIELPFEDVLDYSEFCLFVSGSDALREGFVTHLLRNFSAEAWARMHGRLREVQWHFEWQHPSERGDAVHMTWDAIARKVPALTLARNKRRRYARSRAASSRTAAMI